MSASESRSAAVLQLAEEFLERYRQGQRPSLKEYIDRHPDLAAEIKEVFPAMALMENVALGDKSLTGAATAPAPLPDSTPPQQLGDYRILREVGRGGMGIVYEAEQVSLGRHVALKVLPRTLFVEDQQRRRFEREAKAAAKLHHTNIVPVFGVGEHDGMPYYVMQFIQGLGLDDVLEELKRMRSNATPIPQTFSTRERRESGEAPVARANVSAADVARSLLTGAFQGPFQSVGGVSPPSVSQGADAPCSGKSGVTGKLSDSFALSSAVKLPGSDGSIQGKSKKVNYWQSVAQIGVQVAEALEHAHKQGIQHRDIKPSNLLLDTRGTVWVTDFGLARAENEDHLTQTGDIVGTLRYMPPEAFEGRADKRGDIYSLGLTLFELLALQPAFAERERHRLIKRLTTEEPTRLDKLNRAIPRDLVTIVHKAIDREPSRRYQTAGELAADLQRFLDDEPIRARQVGVYERSWRWCRRNPTVAGLLAAVFLLLVAVAGLSSVAALHFAAARTQEQALRQEADAAWKRAETARQSEAEQHRQTEAARAEAEGQKQRAEENFRQARQAVDDYLTRVSENRLLRVPGMQPLRKELLQSALQYYQGFLKQRNPDAALNKDLASAYLRMATITAEIGPPTEALDLCGKARQVLEDLQHQDPNSNEVRLNLVACHQTAGNLHRRLGQLDAALQSCQQAYRILLQVSPQDPNRKVRLLRAKGTIANGILVHSSKDPEILGRFFRILNDMGAAYRQMGELGAALYHYDQALLIQQSLVRDHPRHTRIVSFQHELAGQLDRLGRLQGEIGMYVQARACHKEARDILERLLREHPRHESAVDFQRDLAASLENDGNVLAETGQLDAALKTYEKALPLRQRLARDNPAVIDYQNDLAQNYYRMSLLHIRTNQPAQALSLLGQAVEQQRGLVEAMPKMRPYALMLSRQLGKLGSVQRQLGKSSEAAQSYQEARTLLEKLPPTQTGDFYELALYRAACADLANEPARRDRDADLALEALRQAIQLGHGDLDRLEKDAELAPLRPRPEFQMLLEDVRRKTKTLRWTEDFEVACAQAAKENKDLFVWFGGSDWAPLDMIQRKTRFSRAVFIDYVDKHFVMVDLDNPRYKPPPKNFAKTEELRRNWHITGYPWGVLTDARGRPYGIVDSDREGTRSLQELLSDLEKQRQDRVRRDELLTQGAGAKGLEKARLLDRALQIVPWQFAMEYLDLVAEILDGDRDNRAGLRSKYLPAAAADQLKMSRNILALRQQRAAADPTNWQLQADLAAGLHSLARILLDLGKLNEAGKDLKQAVLLLEALVKEEPQNAQYQDDLTASRRDLGSINLLLRARRLIEQKNNAEAEAALAKIDKLQSASAGLWKERGRLRFALGQTDKAADDFRKAVELLGDKAEPTEPPVSEADKLFAQLADDALLQSLTAALERSPQNTNKRWQRGDWHARHGRWQEAAADYTIALQRTPNDSERWLHAAPVLALGDRESYHRRRREMLKRFAEVQNPVAAERVAKAYLLLPETDETEAAWRLAERSVTLGKDLPWIHYFVFCKGLADYRRGNFRAVVEKLDPLASGIPSIVDLSAMCHLVSAMAHHRQEQAKAAREHLAEGAKLLKPYLHDLSSFHMDSHQYRHDWVNAWLLYHEAQALIEGSKAESQK